MWHAPIFKSGRGSPAFGGNVNPTVRPRPGMAFPSLRYRLTGRLWCCRLVGAHMMKSQLVQETPWNHNGADESLFFKKLPLARLNLDIDGWLLRIGLEQYAQRFREHGIDS